MFHQKIVSVKKRGREKTGLGTTIVRTQAVALKVNFSKGNKLILEKVLEEMKNINSGPLIDSMTAFRVLLSKKAYKLKLQELGIGESDIKLYRELLKNAKVIA